MVQVASGRQGPRSRGPVGAVLQGKVSVLSNVGIGYVLESGTGRRYVIARELDVSRFDHLHVGQPIAFRANEYNAVAEFVD